MTGDSIDLAIRASQIKQQLPVEPPEAVIDKTLKIVDKKEVEDE